MIHEFKLSKSASELLDKLVTDYCSQTNEPPIYKPQYNAGLIYNLFKGSYRFSAKDYTEIFNAITQK